MEIEDLLMSDETHPTLEEKRSIQTSLLGKSVPDLLDLIDTADRSGNVASRVFASKQALESMSNTAFPFSSEDKALASMSLRELYAVSMGDYVDASDYQVLSGVACSMHICLHGCEWRIIYPILCNQHEE